MPITRVQLKSNTGATNSLGVTLDAPPTAGNYLVVMCACVGSGANTSVGLDPNITWISFTSTNTSNTTLFYGVGRVFSGAGSTVTVTAQNSGGMVIALAEYSGQNMTVDRFAQASGNSASCSTGVTGVTSKAGELWLGACSHRLTGGATFSNPTNGFTIILQDKTSIGTTADRSLCVMEVIGAEVGAASCQVTASGSGFYLGAIMTFHENPVGGGGGETAFGSSF